MGPAEEFRKFPLKNMTALSLPRAATSKTTKLRSSHSAPSTRFQLLKRLTPRLKEGVSGRRCAREGLKDCTSWPHQLIQIAIEAVSLPIFVKSTACRLDILNSTRIASANDGGSSLPISNISHRHSRASLCALDYRHRSNHLSHSCGLQRRSKIHERRILRHADARGQLPLRLGFWLRHGQDGLGRAGAGWRGRRPQSRAASRRCSRQLPRSEPSVCGAQV